MSKKVKTNINNQKSIIMSNQVRTIAPNHLEVLKKQLSKESYKKAKELSILRDCSQISFAHFISLIQ